MSVLTETDLNYMLESAVSRLSGMSPIGLLYGLAAEVLLFLVGPEWVTENIFHNNSKDKFFQPYSIETSKRFQFQDRVADLAETLFNFQEVPGLEQRIESIKRDRTEAYFAELHAAKLLYSCEIPFAFRDPINKLGEDYDAVARVGTHKIACEFKCKVEETDFSENTVRDTLSRARRQLPKDLPCLIFLRIPEHWAKTAENENQLKRVIDDFFRATRRVTSVVYHWEAWNVSRQNEAVKVVFFRERVNANARHQLGQIIDPAKARKRKKKWLYFSELIKKKVGQAPVRNTYLEDPFLLSNGFAFHALLRFIPQKTLGEHVFYDLSSQRGSRLTLLLTAEDRISIQLVDRNGSRFEITTDEPFQQLTMTRFVHLHVQLKPALGFTEMSIWINNKVIKRKSVTADQKTEFLPNYTVGADLNGTRNTAFELGELLLFSRANSPRERSDLSYHFTTKWALNAQSTSLI